MKKGVIIFVLLITLIVLFLLFKRPIQKRILGIDSQFVNFLYSDFDSPAKLPEDKDKVIYRKKGKDYIRNSGMANMNLEFLLLLDEIDSNLTDINLYKRINSAFRTAYYNDTLPGAVDESAHTKGLAVDISIKGLTDSQVNRLIEAIRNAGIKRIGRYSTYIHIDIDSTKPQTEW